ncbi:MAG: hypothetical protein A2X49_01325 [Lentisphaerae bacterium GWF2_52_8]|nr:MAG: hypothetical protein A2X49_01325 [Lentisphaerae bacterium GWF2_52_8]
MKIVIVGGVAGGATAAARARRLDEKAEILIFERGEFVSFANCGLPYHVGGAISKRENLLLMSPAAFKKKMNIDVRVRHEVLSIDRSAKQVEVRNLASGESFREPYDKLILSTGSSPLRPPIPGADDPDVHTLWTLPEMDMIIERMKTGAKSAVVIGAGFIGLELVENFRQRGLEVVLIQRQGHVLRPFDPEMAHPLAEELRSNGVKLLLDANASAIEKTISKNGQVHFKVTLQEGGSVSGDIVVLSAGVKPNSELAREAGLALGPQGGILVDAALKTSDPDILAVGDAIQVKDFVLEVPAMIPLAGPANRQGRIAAANALGADERYEGSQGTSVCKVFDLVAASSGPNEQSLRQAGREYFAVYVHPYSHVTYYPGASMMHIKALFDKSGKILGAQIVGRDGVDKRIDILSTAIRHGFSAADFASLELSYAPPYGAAKDPVNFVGFVAENILSGGSVPVYPDAIPGDAFLLDVREPDEFDCGALPGAVNIPLGELRKRMGELPKDREIIAYCRVGIRGYNAECLLRPNGFKVKNLSGGYLTWRFFNPEKQELSMTLSSTVQKSCAATAAASSCSCSDEDKVRELNVCGLQCPGPIVAVKKALDEMCPGETLKVTASDEGFLRDLPSWCKSAGQTLLEIKRQGAVIEARVQKSAAALAQAVPSSCSVSAPSKRTTLVLFSNDLDKAMAAFIIGTGFASLGHEVNIFCTFWGLNVLRKDAPPALRKDILSRMFGMMMPCGARKLALSKMHMLGMGTAMMKHVMATKNVSDLPSLIAQARGMGVKLLACEMAMNVMGIQKAELIDGVETAGVANFASLAEQGGPVMFI